MEGPSLERILISGRPGGTSEDDGWESQCSPWAWKVGSHKGPGGGICFRFRSILRETDLQPFWPDGRIGTVPPFVRFACDCGQEFIGLGPT